MDENPFICAEGNAGADATEIKGLGASTAASGFCYLEILCVDSPSECRQAGIRSMISKDILHQDLLIQTLHAAQAAGPGGKASVVA